MNIGKNEEQMTIELKNFDWSLLDGLSDDEIEKHALADNEALYFEENCDIKKVS